MKFRYHCIRLIVPLLILNGPAGFSQNPDNAAKSAWFSAKVTVTTKGISTIPNLTLGKPAAIFDMVAGRRLTFEPQFRFSLEAKPWSFLFWWRYKLVTLEKFRMNIGMHPAFSFQTINESSNGISREMIRVGRYLASEIAPTLLLTNKVNIGIYHLYSHGFEEYLTNNTHLVSFRIGFTNIRLTDNIRIGFNPMIYYLNMDEKEGYYFNSTLTLSRTNFPVSLSALVNSDIKTEIPAKDSFLWNVSLIYVFNREYVEKR